MTQTYLTSKLRDLMYEFEAEARAHKDEISNRDRRLAELIEQLRLADERERTLEAKDRDLRLTLNTLVQACLELDLTGQHAIIVRIREAVVRAKKLLHAESP